VNSFREKDGITPTFSSILGKIINSGACYSFLEVAVTLKEKSVSHVMSPALLCLAAISPFGTVKYVFHLQSVPGAVI
jgi:hypothetical protein